MLLIFLLGLAAMVWVESHWLARVNHVQGWARAYNRALMDSLLGVPSRTALFFIPEWLPVVGMVGLLLPLWRRLHRLGS
jgi:hypothetical protein